HEWEPRVGSLDGAFLWYGQLAVFHRDEAADLLAKVVKGLRPGGRFCVEMLAAERVDRGESKWWFRDEGGLWGKRPFLHLGERFWDEAERASIERYFILHLEEGKMEEIHLRDYVYEIEEMVRMMKRAGFKRVEVVKGWGGLGLYDEEEWVVYIGEV
ncbi:MAG TPA: hypothetical protein VLL52_02205, partial [Anaerolineae bacterium]|nr:hypothetical protein [Anaerolineae bacterium]